MAPILFLLTTLRDRLGGRSGVFDRYARSLKIRYFLLKGLYQSQEAEKRRKFVNFFFKAEARIYTELFALKRATFKERLVIFCRKIFTFITKMQRNSKSLFKNGEQDIY